MFLSKEEGFGLSHQFIGREQAVKADVQSI